MAKEVGAAVFSENEFLNIITQMSAAFSNEHNLEAADFKKINNLYQEFNQASKQQTPDANMELFCRLSASFTDVLLNARGKQLHTLFSDLFHMHINRLFSEIPRTHEMIIYYLKL